MPDTFVTGEDCKKLATSCSLVLQLSGRCRVEHIYESGLANLVARKEDIMATNICARLNVDGLAASQPRNFSMVHDKLGENEETLLFMLIDSVLTCFACVTSSEIYLCSS